MAIREDYLRYAEGDNELPEGALAEKNIPITSSDSGFIEFRVGSFFPAICRFDADDIRVSTTRVVRTATSWVQILLEEARVIPAQTGEVEVGCPLLDVCKCAPCPNKLSQEPRYQETTTQSLRVSSEVVLEGRALVDQARLDQSISESL